jgi:hypothetical protein
MLPDTWTHHRARIAARKRHYGPDADVSDLARDLRAARAEDYIRGLVTAEPPLSVEQRAHLARLLVPGGGA